jgi:hypothetical protein
MKVWIWHRERGRENLKRYSEREGGKKSENASERAREFIRNDTPATANLHETRSLLLLL